MLTIETESHPGYGNDGYISCSASNYGFSAGPDMLCRVREPAAERKRIYREMVDAGTPGVTGNWPI